MIWQTADGNFDRRFIGLVIIIAVIISVLGLYTYHLAYHVDDIEEIISDDTSTLYKEGGVLVYITGAVKNPGVYEMSKESHIYDAIQAAGDILPYADVENIDLTALVGESPYILIKTDPQKVNINAIGKVNINYAGEAELMTLKGIGKSTAEKISHYRKEHGLFFKKEDLKKVPGIGETKYSKIEEQITL